MSSRASSTPSSSSPAARLPVELLCYVFLEYRDFESVRALDRQKREDIPIWVPGVLHVCRAWRSAALSCASLWTELNFINPEWTSKFLQLSRELPLDVYADFSPPPYRMRRPGSSSSTTSANKAMAHLQRIRQLAIRANDKIDVHRILMEYAEKPALLLETLVLDCTMYSMSMVEDFATELFAGQTPALRVLRVRNASFQPKMTSNILHGLTHLEMTGAFSWRWFGKTRDMLDMLETSPRLESLKLEYSIPSNKPSPNQVPTTPLDPSYTIAMPSLRKLDIHDYYDGVCRLIGHLTLPPSHSMHLTLTFENHVDPAGRARVASLASQIHMDPEYAVQSLWVDVRSSRISFAGGHSSEPSGRGCSENVLKLTMDCPSRTWNVDELFTSTVQALPIDGTRSLDVHLRQPMEQYVWQTLFRSVPFVTNAQISGMETTHEFLQALGANPALEQGPEGQISNALDASPHNLVHLERVSLMGIAVDEEWCELLVEAILARRRLGGSKLRRLHIETAADKRIRCATEFERLEDAVSLVTSSFANGPRMDMEISVPLSGDIWDW
ncbi:hypothetical protein EVG20_g2176 [Dentipellis fragilis]|uniref:Uncharacterized protein n=1 Tax=Dentipellis fragilis TaxID=205917 RepID=A0A4Y9ZAJ3_9AGAM|nr:hypothetical protein EVG20_g2176 [Dentipellis fragilis]